MAAVLIPVVIVVVALILGMMAAKRFVSRQQARADRLVHSHDDTVRYQVPHGQDPAAVLLGLNRAGYEAVGDPAVTGTNELLIGGRAGRELDREELRAVLAHVAQLNMEGDQAPALPPIRFADE